MLYYTEGVKRFTCKNMTTRDESYWYFKNFSHYSHRKCSEMFREKRWELVIKIQRIKLATKIMTADVTFPRL